MQDLPNICTYTGSDGAELPEDSNSKDLYHLADTIRNIYNLNLDDLPTDKDLSKEQVV